MSLAVTLAKAQGVEEICLPSAGNAGISAAAYCKEAGIKCHVFLPETIPNEYKKATEKNSKNVYLSGKTISDAGKAMIKKKVNDWFDISTLKEPFRVEGKKTLGYEIAEQLEHIKSEKLVEKIDKLLGYPNYDPHGDPIPDKHGKIPQRITKSLFAVEKGKKCIVLAVCDTSKSFLSYLEELGISIKTEIAIVGKIAYDNSIKIKIVHAKTPMINRRRP